MLLGLKVEKADKPRLGKVWNKVSVFPNAAFPPNKRSASQGASQNAMSGGQS